MKRFQTPVRFDETRSEIVDELRVRRVATTITEIARRSDDASAKVIVPDSVDDRAREEHVAPVGDPFGQLDATGPFGAVRWQTESQSEA